MADVITRPDSPGAQYLKALTRRRTLHPDEVIADALADAIEEEIRLMVEFYEVEGRPAFTVPLTEEEELVRFMDPALREEILTEVQEEGGDPAVRDYTRRMVKVMERFVQGRRMFGET
jgi:hypothetical protein